MICGDLKNCRCPQASYLKLKEGCRELRYLSWICKPSFPGASLPSEGIRPAGVLVEGEVIREIVTLDQVPPEAKLVDFGDAAILPGLIDAHVHINDPGRTEWEGFETATRAAAAGGFTCVMDMPLNCVPATTSVGALEAKRAAAKGRCWVDWAAWGGVVADNQRNIT